MKTLFVLASVVFVLFLATPVNKIEAQGPDRVSRLEARVAELEKRLAEIEERLTRIAGTTSGAAQAQSGPNRKLSQDTAEKTIKGFASTNSVGPMSSFEVGDCSFNVESILRIQPLSQFSDMEATSIVILKCANGAIAFKFVFQKDIDNRWFLTKIGPVEGANYNTGQYRSMITRHQNLKVLAQ